MTKAWQQDRPQTATHPRLRHWVLAALLLIVTTFAVPLFAAFI